MAWYNNFSDFRSAIGLGTKSDRAAVNRKLQDNFASLPESLARTSIAPSSLPNSADIITQNTPNVMEKLFEQPTIETQIAATKQKQAATTAALQNSLNSIPDTIDSSIPTDMLEPTIKKIGETVAQLPEGQKKSVSAKAAAQSTGSGLGSMFSRFKKPTPIVYTSGSETEGPTRTLSKKEMALRIEAQFALKEKAAAKARYAEAQATANPARLKADYETKRALYDKQLAKTANIQGEYLTAKNAVKLTRERRVLAEQNVNAAQKAVELAKKALYLARKDLDKQTTKVEKSGLVNPGNSLTGLGNKVTEAQNALANARNNLTTKDSQLKAQVTLEDNAITALKDKKLVLDLDLVELAEDKKALQQAEKAYAPIRERKSKEQYSTSMSENYESLKAQATAAATRASEAERAFTSKKAKLNTAKTRTKELQGEAEKLTGEFKKAEAELTKFLDTQTKKKENLDKLIKLYEKDIKKLEAERAKGPGNSPLTDQQINQRIEAAKVQLEKRTGESAAIDQELQKKLISTKTLQDRSKQAVELHAISQNTVHSREKEIRTIEGAAKAARELANEMQRQVKLAEKLVTGAAREAQKTLRSTPEERAQSTAEVAKDKAKARVKTAKTALSSDDQGAFKQIKARLREAGVIPESSKGPSTTPLRSDKNKEISL